MPKSRKPISKPKKKRRLGPGLIKHFQRKRELKAAEELAEGDDGDSQVTTNGLENSQLLQEEHFDEPGPSTDVGSQVGSGRRICVLADILQQLKTIEAHGPFGCSLKNLQLVNEKREGLKSQFSVKCDMCGYTSRISTELPNPKLMDINTSAVSGTMSTGGGHAQLEEMLSSMNIPPMSDKTYRKYEDAVCRGWTATAQAEMRKAAEEEARLARARGDVDTDGVPLITVVADGSWCKRSYRTNYSSLSGVAAIVGDVTRKVLYIGVKNKYCTPCARAETSGKAATEHTCYKNWGTNQSSTSMEAAIISEGFLRSEEMYGIRYSKLIADGDSNVYHKILDTRPYKSTTVQKIECTNHLLRNLCNKLKSIATTSTKQKNTVYMRKKVGDNILRCRMAVFKAAEHRRKEAKTRNEMTELLRQDILNVPSHVFGEHKMCKERGYFCELTTSTAPDDLNFVPALINDNLYNQICDVFRDLSRHASSLLAQVTSNTVEHYNSIIAKFIGGKRINFALRGSYQSRCSAAVVQHNSGRAHYYLHKEMYKTSPGVFTKLMENKRKRSTEKKRSKKRCKKSLFGNNTSSTEKDQNYGFAAQKPDINEEIMRKESMEFLANLEKTEEEIKHIERDTIHQSNSGKWLEMRRNLLTASNFGRVCKMKPSTGCGPLVKQLLYSSFDCESMAYGRRHEDEARQQISQEIGEPIDTCGLFIFKTHPFLGATPDGLIGEDGIVEIKCPSSAKDMTPDEAISARKITFWNIHKETKSYILNKNHNYFYQVQGQLQATGRNYCVFAVWTPKGLKFERIVRDDEFWKTAMFPKLERFYKTCLLPELVDPRHPRSMPIRNPAHIIEAQERLATKRKRDVL